MQFFTLDELTNSNTANRLGILNKPTDSQRKNIIALIENTLDPARRELGMPIFVTSGFRSPALNKAIKGAQGSQHLTGEAADLHCNDMARLFAIIKQQGNYDQLIWEFGDCIQPQWVHVSYKKNQKNRQQVLRAIKDINGKTIYKTI